MAASVTSLRCNAWASEADLREATRRENLRLNASESPFSSTFGRKRRSNQLRFDSGNRATARDPPL